VLEETKPKRKQTIKIEFSYLLRKTADFISEKALLTAAHDAH